jgi:PrtD family type I secretion system ABC transporter
MRPIGNPSLLEGHRHILVALAFFGAPANLLMLTVPLYMLQLYTRVLGSGSIETLVMLTIIAVPALVAQACFEAMRGRLLIRLGARLEAGNGDRVLLAQVATAQRGSYRGAQALRDLQEVRSFLGNQGLLALFDFPWVPLFVAVIYVMHPLLGLLAGCGCLVLLALGIFSEMASRGSVRTSAEAGQAAMRQAEAFIRHAEVVRAMGMEEAAIARWRDHASAALAPAVTGGDRIATAGAAARMVRMTLQLGVLGIGIVLVLRNELTVGVMIAGSILMARALAPVEVAIGAWRNMVSARAAFRRLKELLASAPPDNALMRLPPPSGHIAVEHVSFASGHPGSGFILRDVSFTLGPGEALGVIGPSGAGKSTLARLLVGIERPVRGEVRLDGANFAEWNRGQLYEHIGYLPQDVGLFAGSVAENIAAFRRDFEPRLIVEAAR